MELKLRNLTKKYGNFTALSQLSVTFTPGIYGILGANVPRYEQKTLPII